MFAPGHKAGQGNDVWLNGMPKSQWYAQNPTEQPSGFYDEAHPYLPAGFTPSQSPNPATITPPQATAPPVPSTAAPVDQQAPRNPIYNNMATQLSPTTMTALSGYGQSQAPRKRPFGGISSGLPFGRNLYGYGGF